MKQVFLNHPSDVLWLLSTHLRGRYVPPFRSFLLFGDEGCPERLELFTKRDPDHDDAYFEVNLKEGS